MVTAEGSCILCGDFNSHNVTWNCTKNELNGIRFRNSISELDLILINDNTLTHTDFHRKKCSNLDLLLSSFDIFDKVTLKVTEDSWSSDRFLINVKLKVEEVQFTKIHHRLTSKRTDWAKYGSLLDKSYKL